MQNLKMNITDIAECIDPKLYKKASEFLDSNHLLRMEQDEELVFSGEFLKRGKNIETEVILDENLDIDEVFCNCGISGLCLHIIATLIGSELMIMQECNDLQSALFAIREKDRK